MITLQEISLRRGTQLLLDHADLAIYAGQKAGIIGKNGSGKTSLFRMLMGELSADTGEFEIPKDLRKAQMRQETAGSSRSAIDYVIDGDTGYRDLEKKLADAEAAGDDNRLAHLHGEFDAMDGWSIRNRAEQLLSGLGFSVPEFDKTVNEFSGGWRIRLNLAQALMTPSDLLLLDEPTTTWTWKPHSGCSSGCCVTPVPCCWCPMTAAFSTRWSRTSSAWKTRS